MVMAVMSSCRHAHDAMMLMVMIVVHAGGLDYRIRYLS